MEFGKFSPEHLKVSKLGLWWDSFAQSWKGISLKFIGELYVMTMKNGCKKWRGIDLSVQNWHEKYDEIWPQYSKISKSCTLMGYFWPNYNVWA